MLYEKARLFEKDKDATEIMAAPVFLEPFLASASEFLVPKPNFLCILCIALSQSRALLFLEAAYHLTLSGFFALNLPKYF